MENSISALALAHDDIEHHVTQHNQFLKSSRLTLDDLNEYGIPLGNLARAALAASEDFITEDEAVRILLASIQQLRDIHAAMDEANDAAMVGMG